MSSTTPEIPADSKSGLQRGAYPIPLGSLTTAGFIGRTERGPVNEPVCISSFPEYGRYFGGYLADGAVAHAVHDFFAHGGRRAVIVRVANRARRAGLDVPRGWYRRGEELEPDVYAVELDLFVELRLRRPELERLRGTTLSLTVLGEPLEVDLPEDVEPGETLTVEGLGLVAGDDEEAESEGEEEAGDLHLIPLVR